MRKTITLVVLLAVWSSHGPDARGQGGPPAAAPAAPAVRIEKIPPTDQTNKFYVSSRAPLAPSPLVRLPPGSVVPRGWLRHQLALEAQGLTGRLEEVSPWCKFDGNAWTNPQGHGHSGWEEMPYWLKGYGDLGYVLKDDRIVANAKKWIEAILATQDATGWFGPKVLLTSKDCGGKADLWPNMLALNVLQSWYEYTEAAGRKDERVLPFMARYFKWEMNYPDADFLAGYWPKMRGGDNLESVYWLYNRTGEPWLLDLAKKIHAHTADWAGGVANLHGVNFTQGFREPAVYWQQAKAEKFLKATGHDYDEVMGTYGQVPGGGFGADENARPGHVDPRQGFETCSAVEYMHSFEVLTRVTGDPLWADRCEDVAFNTFPASQTKDLKGLHYLTAPNQVSLDRQDKSPGIENKGTMFSFSPFEVYRCCQHNVSHGWPYFVEEMWLATADNGLCASLYAASEVTARVGDAGTAVTIAEQTDYPFTEELNFAVSVPAGANAVKFPLYLRMPKWCPKAYVVLNGAVLGQFKGPGEARYLVLHREWADGDKLTLRMPAKVAVRRWEKNGDSVSVDRGPLTYSMKIGEKWTKYGGTDAWPEYEVTAATPWNYALGLNDKDPTDPAGWFVVQRKKGAVAEQPWTVDSAPIELLSVARKVPNWKADAKGLVQPLQPSPVKVNTPEETVTLVPMGCARLRISAFPVLGTGADAREWVAPQVPPVSASHCFDSDAVEAMTDGKEPKNSGDKSIPRFTWWDHKGTDEWVQWDFGKPRQVAAASVYWFDDRALVDGKAAGGCRVPASWEVAYLPAGGKADDPADWKPVKAAGGPRAYGVERDKYNEARFAPVEAVAVRLRVKLQKGFSGGILEWKVR